MKATSSRYELHDLILRTRDLHLGEAPDTSGLRSVLDKPVSLTADETERTIYQPTPTGQRIHASPCNIVLAIGPYGCGKSYMSWQHQIAAAANYPESEPGRIDFAVLAVRNTYRQLRDSMVPTLLLAWPKRWKGRWTPSNAEFNGEFLLNRNGRDIQVNFKVLFRAMDSDLAEGNLRSVNVSSCVVSEASEIRLSHLLTAFSRTGRWPSLGAPSLALWETNNFSMSNPLYKFAVERIGLTERALEMGLNPDTMLEYIQYPDGLGPDAENTENLPENYYAMLAAQHDEKWVDIYVRNKFGSIAPGRLCYREWNPKENLIAKYSPNPTDPIWIGFDAGRDSAYVLGQAKGDGHMVIFDEIWFEDTPFPTACQRAFDYFFTRWPRKRYNWQKAICDPGTDTRGQADTDNLLVTANELASPYDMSVVKAWTNIPDQRIEAVDSRLRNVILGKRELLISEACRHLRDAMTNYYKKEIKSNNSLGETLYHEKPEKNIFSHIAEALQYWVLRDRHSGKRHYVRDADGQFISVKRQPSITINNPGSAYNLTGHRIGR